ASVNQRKQTSASYREERHGFRETVDGGAPLLIEQIKNGGNQRAGVADTDPPHEIDDGEAPTDGNVDGPDSDAFNDQPADGDGQHAQHGKCDCEACEPTQSCGTGQNRGADLLGYGLIGMTGSEDWNLRRIDGRLRDAHTFSVEDDKSGFGLRTAARWVVRGRALSSPRVE